MLGFSIVRESDLLEWAEAKAGLEARLELLEGELRRAIVEQGRAPDMARAAAVGAREECDLARAAVADAAAWRAWLEGHLEEAERARDALIDLYRGTAARERATRARLISAIGQSEESRAALRNRDLEGA